VLVKWHPTIERKNGKKVVASAALTAPSKGEVLLGKSRDLLAKK